MYDGYFNIFKRLSMKSNFRQAKFEVGTWHFASFAFSLKTYSAVQEYNVSIVFLVTCKQHATRLIFSCRMIRYHMYTFILSTKVWTYVSPNAIISNKICIHKHQLQILMCTPNFCLQFIMFDFRVKLNFDENEIHNGRKVHA